MQIFQNGIREIAGQARAHLFPVRHGRTAESTSAQRLPAGLQHGRSPTLPFRFVLRKTDLIQPSDVVLPENTAQGLVDAVSCPSEAVLVAGPAPARFGCAQQRRGKHQENHEKPDSLHGTEGPEMSSRSVY